MLLHCSCFACATVKHLAGVFSMMCCVENSRCSACYALVHMLMQGEDQQPEQKLHGIRLECMCVCVNAWLLFKRVQD
jgi:hypothetical protein